jgi:hypothetical protein
MVTFSFHQIFFYFFVDTLGLEPKPSDGAIRHTVTPLLV